MRLVPVRLSLALTLALTGVVMVPGTSIGETTKVKAAGSSGSYKWKPKARTIAAGDKVLWKNPTSTDHTITAYSSNWNEDVRLDPNQRLRLKFARAGTYLYRCKLHSTLNDGECSGMCGKVNVN
ncbi:MAG TPA: plastocyanin/azurin family copper-binding protein [Actinomycetota bacterium]